MNSVLITGAMGVLGQAVAHHFGQAGYHVIQTGRNTDNKHDFLQLDVLSLPNICKVIQATKPNLILHLAATFVNDFDLAFAVNFQGAKNLLQAMKQLNYESRVILIGSAAEYGLVQPKENPIQETRVLQPVSIYGISKSWQTQWGLMCAHQGQDVIIARIFNLAASQFSNRLFIGLINQQITAVLAGKQAEITVGPLSAVRDYISLEEASQQLLAISRYGKAGNIYHVASGKPVQMREFLQQCLMSHGLNMDIVNEAQHSKRSGYDVPVIYADIARTHALMETC